MWATRGIRCTLLGILEGGVKVRPVGRGMHMAGHLAEVMSQLLSESCVQTKVPLWRSVRDPKRRLRGERQAWGAEDGKRKMEKMICILPYSTVVKGKRLFMRF